MVAGRPGLRLFGDGQLFDQERGRAAHREFPRSCAWPWARSAPHLLPLLEAALGAPDYDACPSPPAAYSPERLVCGASRWRTWGRTRSSGIDHISLENTVPN